jgi:hypothetical protein
MGVSPSQATRSGAPLPEMDIGRKPYVVPSTKLNLVQISIISAVIFDEGDHDGASDQRRRERRCRDQNARETGCDTMTAALSLCVAAIAQRTQF